MFGGEGMAVTEIPLVPTHHGVFMEAPEIWEPSLPSTSFNARFGGSAFGDLPCRRAEGTVIDHAFLLKAEANLSGVHSRGQSSWKC